MKFFWIFFYTLYLVPLGFKGQTVPPSVVNSVSEWQSYSISKILIPPELSVSDVTFSDKNEYKKFENNKRLDALENGYIEFTIHNNGKGDAVGLQLIIENTSMLKGLVIKDMARNRYKHDKAMNISNIPAGKSLKYKFHLEAKKYLETGWCDLKITVKEPNGLDSDPFSVQFETLTFLEPRIEITDFNFKTHDGGPIKLKKTISLILMVQNTGDGKGDDINLNINLPNNIVSLDRQDYDIGVLGPGQTKKIEYPFALQAAYNKDDLNIEAVVTEKYKKYGSAQDCSTELDQNFQQKTIVIDGEDYRPSTFERRYLQSDVDRDIPMNTKINKHKYALIIGNEDYTSKQKTLTSAGNVDYAINDATVFREYAIKTLGTKESQVFLITDGTVTEINRAILKIVGLAKIDKRAEIIFYYAGHGYPDDDKNPYLMPVDVSVDNIEEYGILLTKLYHDLNKSNAKKITVFLDACFSGGARNSSLLATRGISIVPKQVEIGDNMVIFASSSGDERSLPFNKKAHGIFTYYLLKKIQKTKGKTTYKEINDFIVEKVQKCSINEHGLNQTPKTKYSKKLNGIWQNWTLY